LFFDDKDMIYVNTTSGNPDDLKFARQIDIEKRTDDILIKWIPDGQTLWSIKTRRFHLLPVGKIHLPPFRRTTRISWKRTMSDAAITKAAFFDQCARCWAR